MTSVTTSEASTAREGQNREKEGTFNCCLNQNITLSKLNDDSSTNDLWIWLADAYRYVNSGCSMDALENDIDRSMKLYRKTQPSPRGMWRLLSEWPRHLTHLQLDASDVTRWDISSMMKNVKCLTLNFYTPPGDLRRQARASRPPE